MYIVCDVDCVHKEGAVSKGDCEKDAAVNWVGCTENLLLLKQFIHCMNNYFYAYIWDELPRTNNVEKQKKQVEKWIANITGSKFAYTFDLDQDEIYISSPDENSIGGNRVFVALTDNIICSFYEHLYDNYEVICYGESERNHKEMLLHVLFTIQQFVRSERIVRIIENLIHLLNDNYTVDQLVLNDRLDDIWYLVKFCGIKPIV